MERLIADANKVKKANGEMAELSINSFADVVEAIHIMQDQMGITGTTAKEASETITGSLSSMKSSWSNLLTGIADDNQNMTTLVNRFVRSTVTAANNLVPRIKVAVNGIKKLINSIVTEVFPKLKKEIPELAPLINIFEWFIKNRSLVVNAVKAIITAFAVNKILAFTQTITDTFRSITSLTTGTTLLTKATSLLNAAWAANPVGVVVAGVTAAIGVFSILAGRTKELTEEEKRHQEAMEEVNGTLDNYKEKMQQLDEQRQEYLDKNMSEIDYYEDLVEELKAITDENGKVKDGYEKRAEFITGQLKDALGIEIEYTDGLVKNYGDLEGSINNVIEAKKAQILIEAHEADYTEAINQKTKLQTAYTKAIKESETAEKDRNKALQDFADYLGISKDKLIEFMDEDGKISTSASSGLVMYLHEIGRSTEDFNGYNKKYVELVDNIKSTGDALNESNVALENSRLAYQNNQLTITNYENALTGLKDKNYQTVLGIYEDTHNFIGKTNEETYNNYQEAITMQEDYLQQLKDNKAGYDKDYIDSETKKTEDTIKNLKDQQAQYKKITIDTLKETNGVWSDNLDNIISQITKKNVEFKEGADGNIQAYIDGVATGEPMSKDQMATVISNVVEEITKKNVDANSAGQYLLDGVKSGISNQRKQTNCFTAMATFGGSLLSTLRASLKERSPSKATKEMGEYLLEGLNVGIDKEEDKTLKNVSNVGKEVISALQDELNQNVSIGEIGIPSVKNGTTDSYYNPLINSFKEALKDMKIELDDYEVGKFVDKTVSNAVFN